jgi:hypothetical protein
MPRECEPAVIAPLDLFRRRAEQPEADQVSRRRALEQAGAFIRCTSAGGRGAGVVWEGQVPVGGAVFCCDSPYLGAVCEKLERMLTWARVIRAIRALPDPDDSTSPPAPEIAEVIDLAFRQRLRSALDSSFRGGPR